MPPGVIGQEPKATELANCSTSIVNYQICIKEKVAGFPRRIGSTGDIIYFSVKVDGINYCGARGTLSELTDYRPWPDSENYIHCFNVSNIVYFKPINLAFLKEFGGKNWGFKFLIGSASIKDKGIIDFIESYITENKIAEPETFEENDKNNADTTEENQEDSINTKEFDVMGTFQTIKFKSEIDKTFGLERLVTQNFYKLFEHFSYDRTILIDKNRLFKTAGIKNDKNENVKGISGIPDAVMLSFEPDNSERGITPLQINLIEYECYGELKQTAQAKSEYFNSHIIPQLMRFASTFDIVTDSDIRKKTTDEWIKKIMEFIDNDTELVNKTNDWVRKLHKNIEERNISLKLKDELEKAFSKNIKIILIIDEISGEQKKTLENIVTAFKLSENTKVRESSIKFVIYTVRLHQRICVFDEGAQYALSYQE